MSDASTPGRAGGDRALEAVRAALAAGIVGIPGAGTARLEGLPILTPERQPAGWFVGLVEGDQLLGFVQLDEELRFHRASTFGAPQAASDWLDPRVVAERARALLQPAEEPAAPFLSYDTHPDRLGWIVPIRTAGGRERRVMVTGTSAFELAEKGGVG